MECPTRRTEVRLASSTFLARGWPDASLNRDQLGSGVECSANGDVVLVSRAVSVRPWKAATLRRVEWQLVNAAAGAATIQDATAVANSRSPFAPAGSLHQPRPQTQLDRRRLLVRERRPIRAAGRIVGTRVAGQLGKCGIIGCTHAAHSNSGHRLWRQRWTLHLRCFFGKNWEPEIRGPL